MAIYARKSKITETGKSVENQITKCKSYANLKFDAGDDDILVYQDEGLSGYYSDRPAYMRMLDDIRQNKIRAVICYKFDRISRRTLDLLNLVEHLKTKHIAFISCTDDVDTSSRIGKILMSLLASISEFERDIIAERIADNMYELAKEGRWLGGTTPTGFYSKKEYIVTHGKKTSINHLEPVPEEQEIVRGIYETFLKNRSLGKVVEWAEERKILSKNKCHYTNISIRDIIKNPVYAIADGDTYDYFKAFSVPIYAETTDFNGLNGLMVYNKTEQTKELRDSSTAIHPEYVKRSEIRDISEWIISVGKHKGIISGKDWIRAQSILEDNRSLYARPNEESRSLLSGLIACPICGENMYTRKLSGRYTREGVPRFNYVCKTKFHDRHACRSKDINGNELDAFVLESICAMNDPDNDYYELLIASKDSLSGSGEKHEAEKQRLQKRLAEIEKEIASQSHTMRNASDAIKNALMADIENLATEQSELEDRLTIIQADQQQCTTQLVDMAHLREIIASFPKLLPVLSYQDKMELVRTVLEKVVVAPDENKDLQVHLFLKGAKTPDSGQNGHETSAVCQPDADSIFYTP